MRWRRVAVAGRRCRPTLHDGDSCSSGSGRRRRGRATWCSSAGPARPGQLSVKRAVRRDADGWWVRGRQPVRLDRLAHPRTGAGRAVVGRGSWPAARPVRAGALRRGRSRHPGDPAYPTAVPGPRHLGRPQPRPAFVRRVRAARRGTVPVAACTDKQPTQDDRHPPDDRTTPTRSRPRTPAASSRPLRRRRCATTRGPRHRLHARCRRRSAGPSPPTRRSPHATPGSQRLVAVVSDGTAVLGLGDIGPLAALPVMEGKSLLFKAFGGLDCVPIVPRHDRRRRDRRDPRAAAPRRSAASTSRTSARRAASRSSGGCRSGSTSPCSTTTSTAPRSWCSPPCANAAAVTRPRRSRDLRVVVSGAGAAGVACARILLGRASATSSSRDSQRAASTRPRRPDRR